MLALFSTGFLQIQSDGKSCTFSKSTVAGDGTFHKIYQLFHNRQDQTGISYTIDQADLAIRQKAFVYSQPDTPTLRSVFYCIGKRIHQGLHLAVIVNKVVTADKFHKGKRFHGNRLNDISTASGDAPHFADLYSTGIIHSEIKAQGWQFQKFLLQPSQRFP